MLPPDDTATRADRLPEHSDDEPKPQRHPRRKIDLPLLLQRGERSYSAEVRARTHDEQSRVIERLIDLAFGALGAEHLDVRVHPAES